MSDTTFGLDDATLERAAEAVHNASMYAGCDCETCKQEAISTLRAALPVIGPAIERALIERLQSYADDAELECDPGTWEPITLVDWLAKFLPVAEGDTA